MRRLLIASIALATISSPTRDAAAQVVTLPTVRSDAEPEIVWMRQVVSGLRDTRYASPDRCRREPQPTLRSRDSAAFQRALDRIAMAGLTSDEIKDHRNNVNARLSLQRSREYPHKVRFARERLEQLGVLLDSIQGPMYEWSQASNTEYWRRDSLARAGTQQQKDSIRSARPGVPPFDWALSRRVWDATGVLSSARLRLDALDSSSTGRPLNVLGIDVDSLARVRRTVRGDTLRALDQVVDDLYAVDAVRRAILPALRGGPAASRFTEVTQSDAPLGDFVPPPGLDGSLWGTVDPDEQAMRTLLICTDGQIDAFLDPTDAVEESDVVGLLAGAKYRGVGDSARLDSLQRVARAVVIRRKLRERILFPVHTRDQSVAFWRQRGFSSLNVASIAGSKNRSSTYTELVSAMLHPFRLSLNAVLATSKDEAATDGGETPAAESVQTDAVTSFLNGGGSTNLQAAFPMLHWGRDDGYFDFMVLAAPRVGLNLPELNSTSDDDSSILDTGAEFHFRIVDFVDRVGLFVQSRYGWVAGSQDFYDQLGRTAKQGDFEYATLAAGVMFSGKYLITWSKPIAGPSAVRKVGPQLSVTLMREADVGGLR